MPGPNTTIRNQKVVSFALDSDTVLGGLNTVFPDGKWYMAGQQLTDVATRLGEFDRITLRRIGEFMNADALGYHLIGGDAAFSGTLAAETAATVDPLRSEMEANIGGLGQVPGGVNVEVGLFNEGKETAVTPIVVNWDDLAFVASTNEGDLYRVTLTDAIPTAVGTNRAIGRVAITSISLDSLSDSPNVASKTFEVKTVLAGVGRALVSTHFADGSLQRHLVGTNEYSLDIEIDVIVNGTTAPTSGSFTVGFSEFEGADAPTGNEALFVRSFIEETA